ncbi:MAG: protein-export membrane protein SecF [uncultured bacterium]|nr:MAG: protein-export membrane protein SecF [uncultured bacterium]
MGSKIFQLRAIWYTLSAVMVATSVVLILVFGLRLGIDFTGGSLLQIRYTTTPPDAATISTQLASLNLGEVLVEPSGTDTVIIKTRFVSDNERVAIKSALGDAAVEESFESIGPTIGQELRTKAISAILLVVVAIILYITWAFRSVSKGPVPAWAYGVSAVIALVHDIAIPLGVFALLGHFYGIEINVMFITALLTVLGFSVHDTIVVFDRIRENLRRSNRSTFAGVIEESVDQTLMRSLNTSMTVIIVLGVLCLFGGESIRYFVLALLIGIAVGTYSSICVASPLLLLWQKILRKR